MVQGRDVGGAQPLGQGAEPGGESGAAPAQARSPGIFVARVLGVPVFLARSWFLVAALVTFLFAPSVQRALPGAGVTAWVVAFGYALLLLLSVLAHELAHAVAARALHLRVDRIVLDLWGGHTQFGAEAPTAGSSLLVAAVGPLANAVIAVLAFAVGRAAAPGGVPGLVVFALAWTNAIVTVFNLVPGLPLDGGRILESVIWAAGARRSTGTLVAGWIGRSVAVALLLWGLVRVLREGQLLLATMVWLVLVAWFLWSGASGAIGAARLRRRADAVSVRALTRPAIAVPAGTSLALALDQAARAEVGYLLWQSPDGVPAGLVTAEAVQRVPAERRHLVPVEAAGESLPSFAVLPAAMGGAALLEALQRRPAARYAVVDGPRPAVVGIVVAQDLVDALTTS